MKTTEPKDTLTPSQHIDKAIKDLPDWRGKTMARLRKLIHEASADIAEDWKWDTPVFACKGNVVAIGAFKDHVKLNFFKGALLTDPKKLFNAGLEAKTSRSVDFSADSKIDEAALKDLIRAAVAYNVSGGKKK
jgi:hypothetical protein